MLDTTAPVHYLALYSGYNGIILGLYNKTHFIDSLTLDKKTASAFLISSLTELIEQNRLHLHDLSFIAAHAGPAPFTTLRIGVATVNGLAFATQIPLIPVNGLEELARIYSDYTILLNAFCDDVYVGKQSHISCQNIDTFLQSELATLTKPMTYIGNGATLYHEKIQQILGAKAHFLHEYPLEASLEIIAHAGYNKWLAQKDLTQQMLPVYLKHYSAKIAV